jgi:hypothetical protein
MVLCAGAVIGLLNADLTLRGASVLSYHNDSISSGVNSLETGLTPANLTVSTFSKRYATGVDGQIYAQPLYVPSVVVTSGPQAGTHNLAFVATQHDSVYAVDADSGVVVWKTSFLASGLPGATTITPVPSADSLSTNISPEIGICGTPVIDPATNLLYVAAKTKQILNGVTGSPNYAYTLYKIDITNGNPTANANILGSTVIGDTVYNGTTYTYRTNTDPTAAQDPFVFGTGDGAITVNGQSRVYFNALRELNRPGLILAGGSVYMACGSHGDNGPYHGWLLGFDKNTLAVTAVLNLTPNGGLGGIWGGGGKPAVDSNGYFYVMTGNGAFDGYNNNGVAAGLDSLGFPVNGDYGDSVVKISTDTTTSPGNQNKNGWGLRVVDYFAPFNNQSLDVSDSDLGSGECTILPDSAGSAAHPHLLVGAGKQGNIYLIDRDSMGKFTATTDNVVQSQSAIGESFDTPAFFNGRLYYVGAGDRGKAFTIANAVMANGPATLDSFGWPGSTPSISANGTANGVVWTLDSTTAQLRAYSAANFGTEIWTSALAPNNRDQLGTPSKFAAPTVADGRVLVGTTTALVVYGPPSAPTGPPAAPTSLVATAISGLEIDLSWTDNATNEAGFAIEQSSDGVNFTQIATVGVNVTTYPVTTNLQAATPYYFRVRAYNSYQAPLSYSGYTNIAQATTTSQGPTLNFATGFAGATSALQLNSTAAIVNNRVRLTNGGGNETGTVWSLTTQNIQKFSTQFTFQLTNPNADGITFAIQNNSPTIVGVAGGGLAYAGIKKSIAVKFDLYSNSGEGINSTGLFVNGANPYTPATDMTSSGINLHSGDVFSVQLTYDGTTLTETITDTTTLATATYTYPINIPTTVGANTAYVGFTGGTGGLTATEDILTWTYAPLPTTAPAAPTNLVATAASGTQINLSWTDNSNNESGFVVQRANAPTGPFVQIGVTGMGIATYMDTALNPNTTYYYEVYATNTAGNSAITNVAYALTPVPPITPSNAQAVAITTTSISMTWTDNANNETAYNIFRKMTTASSFAQIATLPPNTTSYTDTNLTPGTSYDYHIQASNIAGYSDFSGFTAATLPSTTLPIVTVSASGPVAVNGLTSGQITLTRSSPFTASLNVAYTVSGTAVSGTDYTALTGLATIPAGASSVNIPVASLPGGAANSTVIASVASTSTYVAGVPASGTVVIESPAYNPTAQTAYGDTPLAGTTGGSVNLNFLGLPGSPTGVVYVWYLNGVAFTTTASGVYTITNAITAQSGTYAVYAYAPGGATGSASWDVTITDPVIVIVPSVNQLSVNDGSSGSFTVSLASAPIANVTVNVAISGTPALTVSPPTLTMTPANYQNQTVAVSAASINSDDGNRSATVSLTAGTSSAGVAVTDAISDAQTAANLTATTYPLAGGNIGNGSGDSSVRASGNWWVDGSGVGGLSGTADSFHFESQSVTGDFQMVVQLQNLVATGATSPLAGLMIRDGSAAGSNFLALAGTAAASGGYALINRTTLNATTTETFTSGANMTYTYPAAWLMLSRVGNILHAFVSSDGTTYYEVTDPVAGITWTGLSSALSIGVFSSSDSTANARAVMSNFSIVTTIPPTLTDADIGKPARAGSASVTSGVYTINGGGADIWGTTDQFNFDSQSVTGNNTVIVHADSVQNTDPKAKSGIMFRNSSAPGSAFVALYQVPNNQVEFQWRDTDGGSANSLGTLLGATTSPKWLEVVKTGSVYTAYYATTTATPAATDWILFAAHSTTFTNTTYLVGLAVTAHNNALLNTSVFSHYSIQTTAVPPPTLSDADIGNPAMAGWAALSNNSYTVNGGGSDIWGASDQFNFDSQSMTVDNTVIVHVDSVQNTDPKAKGGIMFRNSSAAGAAFVGLYQIPNNTVELQWRDTDNSAANWTGSAVGATTQTKWLKLVKSGSTFTAYYATTTAAPLATDWVLIAVHTTTFTNSSYLEGLAVTAHNNALLNTSVFSGFLQQ